MAIIKRRRKRDGKLRYGVRVKIDGKDAWVGTFDTLAEARKAQRAAQDDRDNLRPGPAALALTCDAWADEWLADLERRRKHSTYLTAAAALAKFREDFKGMALQAIDRERDAKPWARRNAWRVPAVITCLNAAVDADELERNPFRGLSHKGPGRKSIQPPTIEEVDALADAAMEEHGSAPGEYGPMLRALILFLGYTGARPGEAFALEWRDVDLQARRVRIERGLYKGREELPKNNRARTIVLPPTARDALLTIPRGSGRVFSGKRGGTLSQSLLTWYWAPVRARALPQRPEVTPYYLRHAAAHYLHVTLGLPDRDVAAQLGHTDGGKLIRELYGHGDVGALERIDAALGNVISADFSGRGGARRVSTSG
jgi:integrase